MSNTKPLWKQLNEARTQGFINPMYSIAFLHPEQPFISITLRSDKDHQLQKVANIECEETPKEEAKANAQYTALAVNNFASVVEALESMLNFFGGDNWEHGRKKSIAQAKEALNNIS